MISLYGKNQKNKHLFEVISELEVIDETNINNILVTIWCVTYNQADTISKAIDGFLMQQTNYSYEIIIFDDASIDGTTDIIREYQKKYPDKIKLLIAHKNTFKDDRRKKLIKDYQKHIFKGRYIATCEGDDYWIESRKLDLQVKYLLEHSECMLCTHNIIIKNTIEGSKIIANDIDNGNLNIEDILLWGRNIILQTATHVYRRELLELPEFYYECRVGDLPMVLVAALRGQVYYMQDVMSVYNYMSPGSWSERNVKNIGSTIDNSLDMIRFYRKLPKYIPEEKYRVYMQDKIQEYCTNILNCTRDEDAFLYLKKVCNHDSWEEKIIQYVRFVNNHELSADSKIDETKKYAIWGTGNYASILSDAMDKAGYEVVCYVETKKSKAQYRGKKVVNLNCLIESQPNVELLVGINPINWSELQQILQENKIDRYYCPFIVDIL